jgi:hypothetical protein
MANAVPIPAHQTGRVDFRHPAFRLASRQGTRWGSSGQALEAQDAAMKCIECESTIAATLHLVTSREEPAHTFKDALVEPPEFRSSDFRATKFRQVAAGDQFSFRDEVIANKVEVDF